MTADPRPKGPVRTMAFLTAPWNSTVHVKAQTKVGLLYTADAADEEDKVQPSAWRTEAESKPKEPGMDQKKDSLKRTRTSSLPAQT